MLHAVWHATFIFSFSLSLLRILDKISKLNLT